MITKIDEFSRTTGLSVESIKQLRDALEKLKAEQIERNPLPYIFGGVRRGNAIGDYLAGKSGPQYMFGNGYVLTKEQSKKMGLESGVSYTKNQLETEQKKAYTDSSKAVSELANKMQALSTILDPVINLFKAMGEEDSILGQITGAASGALSSAASTAGAFDTLGKMKGFEFLQNAGPYAAAASAALSIGGSLIKAFGADYTVNSKTQDIVAEVQKITNGHGCTVAFDSACFPGSLTMIMQPGIVCNAGRVVPMGFCTVPEKITQQMINGRELTICGTRMSLNQWIPTAQKMAEGKYHMEGLATTFVKFSEIEKVFNNIVHPDPAVKKTVILFDGAED